jgi:hypothetical protein
VSDDLIERLRKQVAVWGPNELEAVIVEAANRIRELEEWKLTIEQSDRALAEARANVEARDRIRELEAALLTARAEGAREMRERAAEVAERRASHLYQIMAEEIADHRKAEAAGIADRIRALPDTPEEQP